MNRRNTNVLRRDGTTVCVEMRSCPFDFDGHEVVVGASVGITIGTPPHVEDAQTLLRSADLAPYLAKTDGRGAFRFFAEEMNIRLQARMAMKRGPRRPPPSTRVAGNHSRSAAIPGM